MCNRNPPFRGNVLSSFPRVEKSEKKNFLQYMSIFKYYDIMLSRNVGILLSTETRSYPQGTESSTSAVYIQIPSVCIFILKTAICMPLLTVTAILIMMWHLLKHKNISDIRSHSWSRVFGPMNTNLSRHVTAKSWIFSDNDAFIVARTVNPAGGTDPALMNGESDILRQPSAKHSWNSFRKVSLCWNVQAKFRHLAYR
jgi:hypothetical protein